jgi:hypothetical protein
MLRQARQNGKHQSNTKSPPPFILSQVEGFREVFTKLLALLLLPKDFSELFLVLGAFS